MLCISRAHPSLYDVQIRLTWHCDQYHNDSKPTRMFVAVFSKISVSIVYHCDISPSQKPSCRTSASLQPIHVLRYKHPLNAPHQHTTARHDSPSLPLHRPNQHHPQRRSHLLQHHPRATPSPPRVIASDTASTLNQPLTLPCRADNRPSPFSVCRLPH